MHACRRARMDVRRRELQASPEMQVRVHTKASYRQDFRKLYRAAAANLGVILCAHVDALACICHWIMHTHRGTAPRCLTLHHLQASLLIN